MVASQDNEDLVAWKDVTRKFDRFAFKPGVESPDWRGGYLYKLSLSLSLLPFLPPSLLPSLPNVYAFTFGARCPSRLSEILGGAILRGRVICNVTFAIERTPSLPPFSPPPRATNKKFALSHPFAGFKRAHGAEVRVDNQPSSADTMWFSFYPPLSLVFDTPFTFPRETLHL